MKPTGSETHVMLRAGGNAIMAVFRDRVSVMPVPGARLTLAPNARTVHPFDQASGMRF